MKKTVLISTAIAATCACAIAAYFVFKPSETDKKFEACKARVLKNIKTPSTAVFGDYIFSSKSNYNATYDAEKFIFPVDAENSFGAKIRYNLTCYHLYDKDGTFVNVATMESN